MIRIAWLSVLGLALEFGAGAEPAGEQMAQGAWFQDPASETVFFAVLEGLYSDGVSNDVVDLIVPPDPKTGQPQMHEHFVYTCPLCHPAFEAFRLYRVRQPFYGQKGTKTDSFGPGLSAESVERLRSERKSERLDAIQQLIQMWVRRRLELMRLPAEERRQWEQKLEVLRERGTKALDHFRKGDNGTAIARQYADWKKCAICDGATGACKPSK